jgi:hypothetical protein
MIAAIAAGWLAVAMPALAEQPKGAAKPGQGVVQKGTDPKTGKPAGFMDYTDDACMDRVKGAAPKAACRR